MMLLRSYHALLLAACTWASSTAFAASFAVTPSSSFVVATRSSRGARFASENDEDAPARPFGLDEPPKPTTTTTTTSTTTTIDDETKNDDYPIDLPSPILLGTSMVLGIASTGSVFELSGGSPELGFAPTAAIAALGAPTCIFLFYAAIRKGIAETEEDDLRFNR